MKKSTIRFVSAGVLAGAGFGYGISLFGDNPEKAAFDTSAKLVTSPFTSTDTGTIRTVTNEITGEEYSTEPLLGELSGFVTLKST